MRGKRPGASRRFDRIPAVSRALTHPPPHTETDQAETDEYGCGGFGDGDHAQSDRVHDWIKRRVGNRIAVVVLRIERVPGSGP